MPMQEQPQMVLAIAKLRSLSQLNGGGLTGASVSEAPVLIITVVSCSSLDQEPLLSSIPSPIQSGHTWAAGRGKARLFSLHLMVANYGMWILLVHLSDSKVRAVKSDHHHRRGFHLRDRFQIPSLVRSVMSLSLRRQDAKDLETLVPPETRSPAIAWEKLTSLAVPLSFQATFPAFLTFPMLLYTRHLSAVWPGVIFSTLGGWGHWYTDSHCYHALGTHSLC